MGTVSTLRRAGLGQKAIAAITGAALPQVAVGDSSTAMGLWQVNDQPIPAVDGEVITQAPELPGYSGSGGFYPDDPSTPGYAETFQISGGGVTLLRDGLYALSLAAKVYRSAGGALPPPSVSGSIYLSPFDIYYAQFDWPEGFPDYNMVSIQAHNRFDAGARIVPRGFHDSVAQPFIIGILQITRLGD